MKASDIVSITPTADGQGYWVVGKDGGLFAFGDAKFHGSAPALGLHVSDVVGMAASPGGGYLTALRRYKSDLQFHFPFRFHYYAQSVPESADHHTIYKRPPIALVAAETKFPGAIGAPVPPSVQRALADVLGDDWVVDQVQQGITFNLGGASPVLMGMGNPAGPPSGAIVRFANRDRTRAIALTAGTVTVETTLYGSWPQFREVLKMALEATEKLLRPAGVTRTGLRYIDEIRVGDVDGAEWSNWLSPAMLSPASDTMTSSGWPAVTWNGLAQYKIGRDRQMVVRYGPQPAQPGFVVNPLGPLRRPGPMPTGPFFMLDFDAFWEPATIPTWNTSDILETYDQLRQPVRALFDTVITDRLVKNVFNQEDE